MPTTRAPSTIRRLVTPLAFLSLAGCGGGMINMTINMPGPGGVTQQGDIMTISAGVIVDARDGTDPCDRLRVYYYRPSSPPAEPGRVPKDMTPLQTGRAIGKYDPQKRQCQLVAVAPPGDYWVAVDYPLASSTDSNVSYYATGRPSLTAMRVSGGAYPVRVVEKQTAQGTIDLAEGRDPLPGGNP